MRKLAMLVLLPLLPAYVNAGIRQSADTVHLDIGQVWEKAVQNNKTIQMRQLQLEGSNEEIKDAKAERLPEITASGEYARVSSMPIYENGLFHTPDYYPVLHTFYKLGGEAYLNIYNGNKTNNKIAKSQIEKQIQQEQKNLTTSQIKLRAAVLFLDLQRSLVFRKLMLNNIAEQEKQLNRIKELKKNGVVLKSDVLRAELQLSRQKLSLNTIDNDIAIANQKLNIMIGEPDEEIIDPGLPAMPDTAPLGKEYSQYLTEANGNAFENKISEQETKLRQLQLKDVKANVSPRVGLFANYAYSYPQIQFYPYSGAIYGLGMAGVSASFSISSLYHNKHKVAVARIALEQQELEHKDTQDKVRQQVNEAYLRYKEAFTRIGVAKTNIVQATENARIINNTYFNQTSLVTDLLEADTQLLQTRFDLAAAQIATQLQYYQLQNVTGNL